MSVVLAEVVRIQRGPGSVDADPTYTRTAYVTSPAKKGRAGYFSVYVRRRKRRTRPLSIRPASEESPSADHDT
jgi:hypothetical protein